MEGFQTVTINVAYTIAGWVSRLWAAAPAPPLTMEETVTRLEAVQRDVSRRETELRDKIEEHRTKAGEYAAMPGRRREAKVQIRLKMLYDAQLQNTHRTLTAIASHLLAIEAAVLNRQVLSALHDGSRALGHRGTDEDAVEDLLDSLDEQHSTTASIMEIIQERPPDAAALDDDAVEQELVAMIAGRPSEEVVPQTRTPIVFPEVPRTAPRVHAENDVATSSI